MPGKQAPTAHMGWREPSPSPAAGGVAPTVAFLAAEPKMPRGRPLEELQWCLGRADWERAGQVLRGMLEDAQGARGKMQYAPADQVVAVVMECGLRGRLLEEALGLFEHWMEHDGRFIPSAAARTMVVRACLQLLEGERETQGWPAPTPATLARAISDEQPGAAQAAANGLRESAAVRRLGALLEQFERRAPGQRQVACSLAMEYLKRHGQVSDALALLVSLRALNVPRGHSVLQPLLELCTRADRLTELVALVEGMEGGVDGVAPTAAVYAEAVEATARAGMLEESVGLFRRMRARGFVAPETVAVAVMSTLARSGDWSRAVALLEEVKAGGGPASRSVAMYTSAIDACGNGGAWEKALELLGQMEAEGVAPNNFAFTATIKACGRAGMWREAARLFAQMGERGLPINQVTYCTMIDAYAKDGRWEDAAATLRAMEGHGVRQLTSHYTAVIDACARAGRHQEALAFLEEMAEKRVPINRVAYTAAVFACGRAGAWDEALRLLLRVLSSSALSGDLGERPSSVTYMLAIDACGRAGQWPVAAYLWDLLEIVDPSELGAGVFNSLICAMDDPALPAVSDPYYARALAKGHVNHWSVRWKGVVDLHYFSRPLAKAAMRHVMQGMVARYAAGMEEEGPQRQQQPQEEQRQRGEQEERRGQNGRRQDYAHDARRAMVIVTGHGQNRVTGPSVVRAELVDFLASEFDPPLRARAVAFNVGRLRVAPDCLTAYARAKLGLRPLLLDKHPGGEESGGEDGEEPRDGVARKGWRQPQETLLRIGFGRGHQQRAGAAAAADRRPRGGDKRRAPLTKFEWWR